MTLGRLRLSVADARDLAEGALRSRRHQGRNGSTAFPVGATQCCVRRRSDQEWRRCADSRRSASALVQAEPEPGACCDLVLTCPDALFLVRLYGEEIRGGAT